MGLSSRCLLGMLSQSSGTVACGWDGYVIRSLVGSFPRFFDEICIEGFDRKEAFGDCGSKAEIVRFGVRIRGKTRIRSHGKPHEIDVLRVLDPE